MVLSDPILGRNHKEYNQGCGLQKIANPLWLRKELFNLYLLTVTVDKGSPDAEHASKEVTVVISRKVKPGYEKEYDEWLRRYLILGKKVPGYVGATIITQGGTNSAIRHIIYRLK
jgi:hypothetical protein